MSINLTSPPRRRTELDGQTVLVIGGSAGMGRATAIRAREEGAELILTARASDRLAAGHFARLAVHIMVNTALTGATFDIDGGQQFVD